MKRKNIEVAGWIMACIGAILVIAFRNSNHSVMWFGLGFAIASLVVEILLEPIQIKDDEYWMDDDYSVFEEENDEDD